MTLLQLVQLAGALAALLLDIPKIWALIEKLRAAGHPEDAPIPAEHHAEIRAEVKRSLTGDTSLWDQTHLPEN